MNGILSEKPQRRVARKAVSESDVPVEAEEPEKLALLLPPRASLRLLRRAAELAAQLSEAQRARGQTLEIAIGLAETDEARWREGEALIRRRAPNAVVRHLAWTPVPVENARRMFANLDPTLDLEGLAEVLVPRDWGWNFQDCVMWLCFADPAIGPVLPLRPIAYYSLGLPERYVPEIVASSIHDPYWARQIDSFRMWRQANVVISDPTAWPDLVSYAGVRGERIELIPDVAETMPPVRSVEEQLRDRESLIWVTSGNAVDDLATCLAGLQVYYREGGSLEIVVAEEASPTAAEHSELGKLPHDLRDLYSSLRRETYRSLEELDRMLVRGGALWSSQIAGGGGEHLLEAERAGLHVLAASYPLTRGLVDRRELSAIFYSPGDALGIADALKEIEKLAVTPVGPRPETVDLTNHYETLGFVIDWLMAMTRAR